MAERPKQIVELADPRNLAAEGIELGRGLGAGLRGEGLAARASGQIAGEDRDDPEEDQRHDVRGVGDREGVDRRQEKEIVSEYREEGGIERGPEAIDDRAEQYRRQEHQRDVRHLDEAVD